MDFSIGIFTLSQWQAKSSINSMFIAAALARNQLVYNPQLAKRKPWEAIEARFRMRNGMNSAVIEES